jgi:2-amino-4-hydroxy-6-hydroxymethyldihydropteridine diphosphokinase
MPEIFVGAGSNADPVRALRRAAAELERRFGALHCSRVYRSSAAGGPAADYLNLVISLSTERDVDSVQDALRAIEADAGRSRVDPAVVALDLDLLLYGAHVDASRRLPRPGLFTAAFVLGPLAELAPDLVHPVTGERCLAAWQGGSRSDLHDVGTLRSLG